MLKSVILLAMIVKNLFQLFNLMVNVTYLIFDSKCTTSLEDALNIVLTLGNRDRLCAALTFGNH